MSRSFSKVLSILQAYLKNSVYDDSLNSFANTAEFFEHCYRMPDFETSKSMITFGCFIICKEFMIISHSYPV